MSTRLDGAGKHSAAKEIEPKKACEKVVVIQASYLPLYLGPGNLSESRNEIPAFSSLSTK